MGKNKKENLSQSPASRYEPVLQKIHNCDDEFLRQKWQDVLKFLEARDLAKSKGLDFPPRKRRDD